MSSSSEIPQEAEPLLTSDPPHVAHLATCRDEKPHVAPLWYNYRDGVVEIATTGRKLANVRENRRVALSVQKAENGDPVWGVTIRGTATIIDDEEEGDAVIRRINRRYGADEDAWSENTAVLIDIGSVEYWQY